MIDHNSFIPFHHYDIKTIDDMAKKCQVELVSHGSDAIGEQFLTLKVPEEECSFSFVSVSENDEGLVYMCVFNNQPFSAHEYRVIRSTNDDFLVRVHHQYDHYDPNKQFIGKLPYHLYQLAKNTIDNEQVIMAHSALDALHVYEMNAANLEE